MRLEDIEPKPRPTVAKFAADLKVRIARAAVAFDHRQLWLGTEWGPCRTCARDDKGDGR